MEPDLFYILHIPSNSLSFSDDAHEVEPRWADSVMPVSKGVTRCKNQHLFSHDT
jgi:hypothetical protein